MKTDPQAKLIVFDLDGTLVDSRRDIATAVNCTRKHYGLAPLPADIVAGYVGDGMRKLIERALADAPEIDRDVALAVNKRFYAGHLVDETRPYPGVMDGLRQLADAGLQLAVLSNKPGAPSRAILEHFGLLPLFCAVIGGDDVQRMKPDPEGVHKAMQAAAVDAAATWVVGDHQTDLEAAACAGARSIFCAYGIGHTGNCRPDAVAQTFPEIMEILGVAPAIFES